MNTSAHLLEHYMKSSSRNCWWKFHVMFSGDVLQGFCCFVCSFLVPSGKLLIIFFQGFCLETNQGHLDISNLVHLFLKFIQFLVYSPLCNILIFSRKLFAKLIMKASKQKPPFKEFTFFSSKENLPPHETKIAKSVWKNMKYLPAFV